YGRDALAEDALVPAEGSGFNSFALAHNVASEAEVDAVLAHVESVGATIVKPAQKVFWGGYSGYFKDPDGHLWELAYNPFEWIGPKDEESA
ncbi:MAG: VOC family protein, partial [Chloroflexota bacterium]